MHVLACVVSLLAVLFGRKELLSEFALTPNRESQL